MTIIAWDTETERFRPGKMAPELVCITWQEEGEPSPQLVTTADLRASIEYILAQNTIVGQNVAYDMAVVAAAYPDLIPKIFQAYKEERVTDTMIRQQLIDISNGQFRGTRAPGGEWLKYNYRLDDLVFRHLGRRLKKDGWRMRYGEFSGLPFSSWERRAAELQEEAKILLQREGAKPAAERYYGGLDPKDLLAILEDPPYQAIQYPLDDASTTFDVYLAQEKGKNEAALKNQFRETYAAFCLHLSTVWGLRTNQPGVDELERSTKDEIEEIKQRLVTEGLVRPDGSRNTKKAAQYMAQVCQTEGLPLRETKKGGVCLDGDACEATEDGLLKDYADFSTLSKTLNADIPMLRNGTKWPIHARYGLTTTGRTNCSAPNLQNLRKLHGIRESFLPRPGYVFIQADFPQLELFTLSQVCYSILGHSELGELLKSGMDPHTKFAADLMKISYDEGLSRKDAKEPVFYTYRQIAKVFNFGKPGGLGPTKLVALAASKQYNVRMTMSEAQRYGKAWLETFPEMREYFDFINASLCGGDEATVVIPQTGFIRGGARYCAACNTGFQGLGAACAKEAVCRVAEAEYVDQRSPLYGCRTVAFIHDEILAEARREVCHEAGLEMARLMAEGANKYLPDCPIPAAKVEPLAMAYWSKHAEATYKEGRLIPWDGKTK